MADDLFENRIFDFGISYFQERIDATCFLPLEEVFQNNNQDDNSIISTDFVQFCE